MQHFLRPVGKWLRSAAGDAGNKAYYKVVKLLAQGGELPDEFSFFRCDGEYPSADMLDKGGDSIECILELL